MMRTRLSVAAFVVIALSGLGTEVLSQSSAVQVPSRYATGNSASGKVAVNQSWPPNNMSSQMRRWESILDNTYPNQFNEEITADQLIRQLNQIGLPLVLGVSAKNDSLDDEEPLKLQLSTSSLRARLFQALAAKNSTIAFRRDYILIISLDDAEDAQYFVTIVYDVSDLKVNPIKLGDTILGTIAPDSWELTGQGLGTIESTMVNGRLLFSFSQTYAVHREIQALLSGFHDLGGIRSSGRLNSQAVVSTRAAKPVLSTGF